MTNVYFSGSHVEGSQSQGKGLGKCMCVRVKGGAHVEGGGENYVIHHKRELLYVI